MRNWDYTSEEEQRRMLDEHDYLQSKISLLEDALGGARKTILEQDEKIAKLEEKVEWLKEFVRDRG